MTDRNARRADRMGAKPDTRLTRQLIGCGLLYWIPVALFIWLVSVFGDCFQTEQMCQAGRREGIVKLALLFGGSFVVLIFLLLSFRRRR